MSNSNKEDIIMITHSQCPHCTNAKKGLKDKIEKGRVKVLDYGKDKLAQELVKKYNIKGVPSVFVGNKDNHEGEVCQLSSDLKKILCKNKEVKL